MFDQEKQAVRKDHSKKGRIDEGIKEICDIINSNKDFYTTSSCSGRIVLLKKGARKCDNEFLYETHEKAEMLDVKKALEQLDNSQVWFKQEALILHVACRDIKSANKLLKCARDSGLKHSGLLIAKEHIVAELIGTDAMETIVAKDGNVLVNDEYLKVLMEEANKKMEKNKKRIELLKKNIISFLFAS